MGDTSVVQSMLDSAGPQAAHIERLWWLMIGVTASVFVVVTGFVLGAVFRRGEAPAPRVLHRAVALATGATVLLLFVLLVASVWTGRLVASLGASSDVTINLVGHQWWWEAEYYAGSPSQTFRTANELHIPVGRPVVLRVRSSDVIHSIWVPALHGKRDLVPGYETAIWLQADRPGVYRGQCAEFCGLQHARMALYVTAEPNGDFERWRANQVKPAVEPLTAAQRQGRDVFLGATCAQCHTIRGTIAGGVQGPDLTHLATRGTLAAGTLPNTHDDLRRWVLDAQRAKPGNQMPSHPVGEQDLPPLLAYLESLQ